MSETLEAEPELLEAAARAVPKAWGALAARGVVRYRDIAGGAPTEAERRAIWAGLWREVERIRAGRP